MRSQLCAVCCIRAAMLPDPPVPDTQMAPFDRAARFLAQRQAHEELNRRLNEPAKSDSQPAQPSEAMDTDGTGAAAASSSAAAAAIPAIELPPLQLLPIFDPVARRDQALAQMELISHASKVMREATSASIQQAARARDAEAWRNMVRQQEYNRTADLHLLVRLFTLLVLPVCCLRSLRVSSVTCCRSKRKTWTQRSKVKFALRV